MAERLIPGGGAFQENATAAEYLIPGDGAFSVEATPSASLLIVEESLLREPNLWVPGKKPVGPVKVDWDNPITAGLVVCVLPRGSDGYLTYTNYADAENPATVSGTATTIDPVFVGTSGEYLLCHPSGGTNGVDIVRCAEKEAVGNTDDMTGISIVRHLNTTVNNTSTVWRGTASGDSFGLQLSSTSNLRCYYIDNSPASYNDNVAVSTTDTSNKTKFWGGRKKGNEVKAYALDDGVFKKGTGTTGGTGTFRSDGAGNAISFVGNPNVSTLHGWIYASFVWRRALSDSEIESVFRDPYQFLIPA